MTVTKPAMRYHGGKFRLAGWIMQFFPPHQIYTEVFGGAAGVLLQKPRSYAEVYNDLDGEVVNLFRVLRDPDACARLIRAVQLTPYSRAEFDQAWDPAGDDVESARRLVVRAQMGFGSAGSTKGSTGFRIDTRREYATAQHLWVEYPENLAQAAQRLQGVLIENRDAREVLLQHDTPETLHFVDPPYVHGARVLRNSADKYYRHELTDEGHAELIQTLDGLRGMVVLSGYDNPLYEELLADWYRHETTSRMAAHRGTGLRTECVWLNSACHQRLHERHGLFSVEAFA